MTTFATTTSPNTQGSEAQATQDTENLKELQTPSKDPFELQIKRSSVIKVLGEEGLDTTFQKLKRIEDLISQANQGADLLRDSSFSHWESHINDHHEALLRALKDGDSKTISTAVDEMLSGLEKLNDFFAYEREQGLIATHAETGVRLYKKGSSLWLVTPDASAFKDYRTGERQAELQKFVKGVTGVTIDPQRASFQAAETRGERRLLGCRIDKLQLNSSELYEVNTKLRKDAELRDQSIRFTSAHISKNEIVDDAAHGFGRVEVLPQYRYSLLNDDIVVPEADDLLAAAPRVEARKDASDLVESVLDPLSEHAAVPVLPDATLRNGVARGIQGAKEFAERTANRFRRTPATPEESIRRLRGPQSQVRIAQIEPPRITGPAEAAVAERTRPQTTLQEPQRSRIPLAEETAQRSASPRTLAESTTETSSRNGSRARLSRTVTGETVAERAASSRSVASSERAPSRTTALETPIETEVPEVESRNTRGSQRLPAERIAEGESTSRIRAAETSRTLTSEGVAETVSESNSRVASSERARGTRAKLSVPVEGEVPELETRSAEARTNAQKINGTETRSPASAETTRTLAAEGVVEGPEGRTRSVAQSERATRVQTALETPVEGEVPKVETRAGEARAQAAETLARTEGGTRVTPAETSRLAPGETVAESTARTNGVAQAEGRSVANKTLRAPTESKVPAVENTRGTSAPAAEQVARGNATPGEVVAAETRSSTIVESRVTSAEGSSRVATAEAAPESARLQAPRTAGIPGVDPNRPVLPRNRSLILRPMETVEPARTALTVVEQPKVSRFAWLRSRLPKGSSVLGNARGAFKDPRVQNTAYLTGLVAMHKALAGDYRPESKHSPLPHLTNLIAGDLADDKLLALGIKTEYTTEEVGVVASWGMDVSASMGDIGAVYGGIKGTHYALNSRAGLATLQRLGLSRVAAVPNWSLRVGGRALGVAYAPLAGYSYTANGAFIHEKGDARLVGRAIGAPLEGAVAGGLVGGPFAPVTAAGGAIISTGAAIYGSFSALDDVLEDNKRLAIEGGIKRTLQRGEQGWIKGDSEPDNPMTPTAEAYIEKLAKADFMRRIIEMKRQGKLGRDFPIYANKWEENWENVDEVLGEIRDYRNKKGYWLGAPLDDLSSSEQRGVSAIYDYVFENKEGTQQAAEKLYRRSFLVEYRDTDTTTAWQAFWHTKYDTGKILITDEVSELGEDFEKRFKAREEALVGADPHAPSTIEARGKLIEEEVDYLRKRFPLMVNIVQDKEFRNQLEVRTTRVGANGNRVGTSALMTSSAIQEILGLQQSQQEIANEMQQLYAATQDPAFQKTLIDALTDDFDKETLRRHFAAKDERYVLSQEQLTPLLLKAYEGLEQRLENETIEIDPEKSDETLKDIKMPKIELSEPPVESVPGL